MSSARITRPRGPVALPKYVQRPPLTDIAFFDAARFLQRPLAKLISTLRAPKSSEGYKAIGGGSPLRRITEEQADALAQSLKGRGLDAKVYVGMRYWTPFIDDAMEQVRLVLETSSIQDVVLHAKVHFSNLASNACHGVMARAQGVESIHSSVKQYFNLGVEICPLSEQAQEHTDEL